MFLALSNTLMYESKHILHFNFDGKINQYDIDSSIAPSQVMRCGRVDK